MLYVNNYTENLIGLQGVIVKNVVSSENSLDISIEMKHCEHRCPCCGFATKSVHDYRYQKIKDISAFGKNVILIYRKRRYLCPSCKKRFPENHPFVPRYYRMTSRLIENILSMLSETHSFTSVAKLNNISVSTAIRIFDLINYSQPPKPP